MSAQTQFAVDQIGSTVQLLGQLEFVVDPLNGADVLLHSIDMTEKAGDIVADFNRTAWVPRAIRTYPKSVLPPGHIIGFRTPTGGNGPHPDPVWALTPAGAVPDKPVIEAEDIEALQPDEIGI